MPLPHSLGAKNQPLLGKALEKKELAARLAKLHPADVRPLHERLTGKWAGKSVHLQSKDETTWDGVELTFAPFPAVLEAALKAKAAGAGVAGSAGAGTAAASSVAVAASSSSSSAAAAPAAPAAVGAAAAPAAAAVTAADGVPQRGTVSGAGSSCWRRHVIPFTIRGEYDLTARVCTVTKQHTDAQFNNALAYTLRLDADPTGPTAAFTLSSDNPNLVLKPLVTAPVAVDALSDREACKVCLAAAINCVLLPCAHLCVCAKCATTLKNTCPICRAAFTQALTVFPT